VPRRRQECGKGASGTATPGSQRSGEEAASKIVPVKKASSPRPLRASRILSSTKSRHLNNGEYRRNKGIRQFAFGPLSCLLSFKRQCSKQYRFAPCGDLVLFAFRCQVAEIPDTADV